MKKIVCVLGSPRKGGNTEVIANKIIQTAESLGATSQTFRLYDMNFKGCVACLACKKTTDFCVLQDDLTPLLEAIREADGLIVASPVYFGDLTGVAKTFIDRLYWCLGPDYLTDHHTPRLAPGKKCVFILSQGSPSPEMFGDVFDKYGAFFSPPWFGYETHLIRGVGLSVPGAAAQCDDLMQQAAEIGRLMAQ